MKKMIMVLGLSVMSLATFAATGTITIKNPNGKSGTFRVITVVTPEGRDFILVVPPSINVDGLQVGQTVEFTETGSNTGVFSGK